MGLFGCLLLLPACFSTSKNSDQFPGNKSTTCIRFPADHGNHMGSLTEWWYFNGHLTNASGKNYSYAFCLFRATALVYFAHLSFTDEQDQRFTFDRIFYPFFKVEFRKNTANISYSNEQIIEQISPDKFRLYGKLKNIGIDLVLNIEKVPMLVNGNGKIDMPEGGKSFYYSLTRLKTEGVVSIDGMPIPVTGNSWMDHQWGNFYVKNKGWDWFSFQMEDSTEYNLYSFRNRRDKTLKQFINVLDEQNTMSSYREMKISRISWWKNEVTSNKYITLWELILPGRRDTFQVTANVNNQEIYAGKSGDFFPSYWEGRCTVIKKTADGRIVKGQGFAEHFPYRRGDEEK